MKTEGLHIRRLHCGTSRTTHSVKRLESTSNPPGVIRTVSNYRTISSLNRVWPHNQAAECNQYRQMRNICKADSHVMGINGERGRVLGDSSNGGSELGHSFEISDAFRQLELESDRERS